jgi:hypothetical protein
LPDPFAQQQADRDRKAGGAHQPRSNAHALLPASAEADAMLGM